MVGEKGMNIDDLIKDREATHGNFDDTATVAQTLKAVMRRGRNWESLPNQSKEALEMIATKVARILNEHWNDVAGYARLRANSFAPGHIESGISSIAKRLRPIVTRVNDEGGAP
jgi:hypothetical protein